MIKQIGTIVIFVDQEINMYTGREYVSRALIQFWDLAHDLVRQTGLSEVVGTESELWEHVERSVQSRIDEGYGIDDPEVAVYRTHKTSMKVDFFDAIGQHL